MKNWKLWSKKEKTIGMEIKDTVVKLVELERSGKAMTLRNYHIENIPEGLISLGKIQDEEKFFEFLYTLKNKAGILNRNLHLSINCQNILLRPLRIPNLPAKELRKAIDLEIEHNIQLPFEDYVSDYSIITDPKDRKAANELHIMLVIASESYINDYIRPLKKLDFFPQSVDLAPLAVQRALMANQASTMDETFVIVNIGEKYTEVSIVHHQILRMVRTFSLDLQTYLQSSADSFADAHAILQYREEQDSIRSFASDIGSELERILNFYLYTLNNRDQNISQMVLIGEIRDLQKVADYLSLRLNIPAMVEGIDERHIEPRLVESVREVSPSLVVPFGLALKDVN